MPLRAPAAPDARPRSSEALWSAMRAEAQAAIDGDPALGGFFFSAILNHDCLASALVHSVAGKLSASGLSADMIARGCMDALAQDPGIVAAAEADILAVLARDPACGRYCEPFLYFKGFQALQGYRFAHRLWHMGRRDFALYLQGRMSAQFGIDIHPAARIGTGIMMDHAHSIVIGETAVVGDQVSMLHAVTLGGTGKHSGDRHSKVGFGVLIGAGAKILGNVAIGRCSRVAAGSVVLQDVPANRTVAGVPARIVGYAGYGEPALEMDHGLPETPADAS